MGVRGVGAAAWAGDGHGPRGPVEADREVGGVFVVRGVLDGLVGNAGIVLRNTNRGGDGIVRFMMNPQFPRSSMQNLNTEFASHFQLPRSSHAKFDFPPSFRGVPSPKEGFRRAGRRREFSFCVADRRGLVAGHSGTLTKNTRRRDARVNGPRAQVHG